MQTVMLQSTGNFFRLLPQFLICNYLTVILVAVLPDMGPVRVVLCMPCKDINQCFGPERDIL